MAGSKRLVTRSFITGIAGFEEKLKLIAEECGEKGLNDKQPGEKDEFTRLKLEMHLVYGELRDGVKERHDLMKKRGNCNETIQMRQKNWQKLEKLKSNLSKMQEINKKQMSKRDKKKKEELSIRIQDIRVLTSMVNDAKDLTEGAGTEQDATLGGGPSATLFGGAGLREAARGDMSRGLTPEEQEELDKMRTRDKQIDDEVGVIGGIVERMVPLAQQIGITAEQQKKQADAIADQVEKNTQEILRQNKYCKEIQRFEKNTQSCCQIVLMLLLLCVVGFIMNQIGLTGR
jgi:hypothetical protein